MPRDPVRRNAQRRRLYQRNRVATLAKAKAYRETHAEQIRATTAEYRERNREKLRWAERSRRRDKLWYRAANLRYAEKVEKRRLSLAGRPRPEHCEICGGTSKRFRLHFDHCHASGLFRGWICHRCNLVLGQVKDSVELLARLADYLRRTSTTEGPPMSRLRKGDHPYKHPSSIGSDHSGAHVRGTSHHRKNAGNPKDGLTPNEGGSAAPAGPGDNDADDMMVGGVAPGGGGLPGGGASM